MKIFGSISELVSVIFRKDTYSITVRPSQTTTYTANRDVQLPDQDANSVLVSRNSTDTLTNKSISGSTNTITNVSLTSGVTGILPAANGGTGQNSSATFPSSGVIVTRDATETLTNKTMGSTNTLTGATAASFSNSGTVTLPSGTHTLISRTSTDTGTNRVQNKDLDSSNVLFVDSADNSKKITFELSGLTTSSTRSYIMPDANTSIVGTGVAQTLTNKTIDGNNNTLTVLAATQLSGAAPIANGGTGQTNKTAAFDALSPSTTKGDIIVYDGTDNIRLAVGTDGQALVANSGAASGLSYAAVVTDPTTTRGDIIVRGASALQRLAAATNNRVLRGNGTDLVSGQIDSTSFFTSGAQATGTAAGIVTFEEYWSGTVTLSDGTNSNTGTAYVSRVGNRVNLYADIAMTSTTTAAPFLTFSNSGNNVPTRFAPTTTQNLSGGAVTRNNTSTVAIGLAQVTSANITLFNNLNGTATYAASGTKGWYACTVSWDVR